MLESLANVVAGLGLFFAGIWFLSENLKRATSRRFRQAVITWTRQPAAGFCVGAVAGALTQSMSVTVFILVGMMRAGLIGVRNALPLLTGANQGISVLVFIATLETELVMLYVIGIVGFIIGLDPAERFRPLIGALFGLSMLFLGINLIQTGAVPLLDYEWAQGMVAWARESYMTALLAGVLLTCISQSSAAVTILAITLADAGVFGVEQTIMIIYGTNLGGAVTTAVLSWNLRGRSMQIAMFQIVFCVVGVLILVPLFYLEVYGGVPLMKALVTSLTPRTDVQLAWVYLFFGIVPAIPLMIALNPVSRLLERFFPPTEAEDYSKPQYIHDAVAGDPGTAMHLVLHELRREFDLIATYVDNLRPGASGRAASLNDRHAAYGMLSNQVMEFIDTVGRKASGYAGYDEVNALFGHQRLLNSTEATLYELATALQTAEHRTSLKPLAEHVVRAIDQVMGDADEAAHDRSDVGRWSEYAIDAKSSAVLAEMRETLMAYDGNLSHDDRSELFRINHLSERFFWLLAHVRIDEFARLDKA